MRICNIRSQEFYLKSKSFQMHRSVPVKVFRIQIATYRVQLHNAVDMRPKRAFAVLLIFNLVGDLGTYVSAPHVRLFLIR
jgi:hypothetical protein